MIFPLQTQDRVSGTHSLAPSRCLTQGICRVSCQMKATISFDSLEFSRLQDRRLMYASFSSPANSIGLMQPLWRPCDKVDTWTDVIRAKDGSPKLGTWGLTAMLILYYTIGKCWRDGDFVCVCVCVCVKEGDSRAKQS
ncbi:hypothetical protein ASPFODRAFT_56778 [Aspergillus luchuensis CBS 106.47]|uniref:Uncharacterized protein n=1 Tax=Aspergillus luchuensis (strain CBS 106.47) TaxID=1137211 RepID=A0A1M3TUX5_ASPLC|nr:hypothetical protein ASPFODRAFT_56778 [Aspergillus luchuensis CBS 106.47]